MVFSSIVFIFAFLPVVLIGYYLIAPKLRNLFLLLASLTFYYVGETRSVWIILTSILINYLFGLFIANSKTPLLRKISLSIGVFLNIALLFYFKYINFTVNIFNSVFNSNIFIQTIALPIGISFFTFQGLTYIVDLYRGDVKLQKNPLNIALYITLFPQLIAGPIVRYKDVNEQIKKRSVTRQSFYTGIKRFTFGLAKKIVIANTAAIIADKIFNIPARENSVISTWIGVLCYAIQIFFDFSGYSDMAIGLGKMFGFDFKENFNYPYISKSITEFWRRWHISLSSFFKDYVYIPLGGNRRGNVYVNLIIVFFLTGLWHGASLNFIVWGLWHGIFMLIERRFRSDKVSNKPIVAIMKRIYTLLVVIIGWVFFRAEDLPHALSYLGRMFGIIKPTIVGASFTYYLDSYSILIIVFGIILSTKLIPTLLKKMENYKRIYIIGETAILVFLLLYCGIYVMASTYNPFIYFRF